MTGFMRWVGEREGTDVRRLRAAAGVVGERARAVLGEHLGVLRGALPRAPYERCLASRATMPGARWFDGAELNYAENMLVRESPIAGAHEHDRSSAATCARIPIAVLHASELRTDPRAADVGRALRPGGGGGGRAARAGRGAGGSGGRLHAEHPRDADRVPGERQHRRDLVERGTGVRGAQRDRPLRADRAEGAARRWTGIATAARTSTAGRWWGRSSRSCPPCATRCWCRTCSRARVGGILIKRPSPRAGRGHSRGGSCASAGRGAGRCSSRCRSTTRCGCCTPRARPACRRRSCTATAGFCWSS